MLAECPGENVLPVRAAGTDPGVLRSSSSSMDAVKAQQIGCSTIQVLHHIIHGSAAPSASPTLHASSMYICTILYPAQI